MGRTIFAVITGVIVGMIIIFIGDATTHKLNPAEGDPTTMDSAGMEAYVASIPVYVLVVLTLFWMLAAFAGGFVAAKINRLKWKQAALITGGILLAASLLNLAMVTHPTWMWIAALVIILPAAYFGGRMAVPKTVAAV